MNKKYVIFFILGLVSTEVMLSSCNDYFTSEGGVVIETADAAGAGDAGDITLIGGTGGTSDGTGGDITITAGDGGTTNGDGGTITLNGGTAAGTGADGKFLVNFQGQTIDMIGMLVHILGFMGQHPVTTGANVARFKSAPAFDKLGRSNIDYSATGTKKLYIQLEINRDQQDVGTTTNPLELTAVDIGSTNGVPTFSVSSLKIGDGQTMTISNAEGTFTVQWLSNGVVLLTAP